jgi:parallel beta-helix repeat protein
MKLFQNIIRYGMRTNCPFDLAIMLSFLLILFTIPFSEAQPQCLTSADTNCDQSVDLTELTARINAWYACSSCVPDIFNALQAYFSIPFCGDWSCDAAIGEDCSNCQHDCGACQPSSSCTDDCLYYSARACDTGTDYKVCGYFDADTCLDWDAPVACPGGTPFCSGGSCVANVVTYTITTSVNGAGGTVNPSGATVVNEYSEFTVRLIPDPGYKVKDIVTAGVSEGGSTSFTYYNIKSNYNLEAYFIPVADITPENIYVDNMLTSDCVSGDYSIQYRDCSGTDGDAYNRITEAADVAGVGDTVLIRSGTYGITAPGSGMNVLWPKHSGTVANPVTFKPYNNEVVVIGDDPSGAWPGDLWGSISRGAISMKNVHNINIEGLTIRQVGGWLYARNTSNVTIKNCWFENAMFGAKGGFRILDSTNWRIINNTFKGSAYDSLLLGDSKFNLIENNTFETAVHTLLALRSASYNVFRNNIFNNYHSEKLTEIFDQKLDKRDSANPSYIPIPGYNATRRNFFEDNFFGFTTEIDYYGFGARTCAMQFSGQDTIIRKNMFSNPVNVANPDTSSFSSGGNSGGVGICMRWGGSLSEAHEAGYVTGNRIYQNTFYGYDGGKVRLPWDQSMNSAISNPPPMKDVPDYWNYLFTDFYAFEDNEFKNNIFSEGIFFDYAGNIWDGVDGRPIQAYISGRAAETYWGNNGFYGTGTFPDSLIYDSVNYAYQEPKTPGFFNTNHPATWSGNIQQNPGFVDAGNEDFRLQQNSQMIDAGAFLTQTVGQGSGKTMQVADAGYFYDGFGIEGEVGDLIQLDGQAATARIIKVDYDYNTLTLDTTLSWIDGQGVSLAYFGNAPDIGKFEYVETCNVPGDCPTVTCQTASCQQGICSYTPVADGTGCSNGLYCDGVEVCIGGGCQVQSMPPIDDGIACTADSCDEGTDTILHVPSDALCDDGNNCTSDACSASSGCSYANVAAGQSCDDGIACTSSETCDGSGQCIAGALDDALCPDKSACKSKTCTITGCTYGSCPSEQGLIGYWEFEDNPNDSSLNSLSSSLMDGASFGPGYYGKGLMLDGDNDYIDVARDSLLSFGGKELTVAGWYKFKDTGSGDETSPFLFGPDVNGYLRANWIYYKLASDVWDGTVVPTVQVNLIAADYLQNDAWYHIVTVYDLSVPGQLTGTFYINGSNKGTDTKSLDSSRYNNCFLTIGKSSKGATDTYFNGTIDDFRVYDRALNSTEIGWLAGLP